MEVLILIALFVAVILITTGKKSNRRSSYTSTRKAKPRLKKTKQVRQYKFDPKYFKPFEGKAHVIDGHIESHSPLKLKNSPVSKLVLYCFVQPY